MVEISEISAVVATAGVVLGVLFAMLQIRKGPCARKDLSVEGR
jgi:hypothetical protein